MTDSEIKLCANSEMAIDILEFIKRGCEKSYQDGGVKKYTEALQMGIDALAETNRQNAEIERLQGQIESLNKEYPCIVKMNDYCLVYARSLDDYDNLIGDISAEGIKEFAERLKATDTADLVGEQYINGEIYGYFYSNAFETKIDSLVKEMTEQRKEDEGK